MFTLKLYRTAKNGSPQRITQIVAAHHVTCMSIGERGHALELWAFDGPKPSTYTTYYIGDPEPGMEAYDRENAHLETGDGSWWGWGLLENWEGNTSEHYRPGAYGYPKGVQAAA